MLIYLHGFNSSPCSTKARTLKDYVTERGLERFYACPALPHQPDEAIACVQAEVAAHRGPCCFVGSSLGGFYATWLAEQHDGRAVLLNPATDPHLSLEPFLGPQQNLYTGERYDLTQRHLEQWERLWVRDIVPQRYLLIVETGDEVLDYHAAMQRYAGATQVVIEGGDHALQSFPEHLERIVRFAGLGA